VLKVMTTEAEKQKDKLTPLERGRLQGDISTAAMAVAADDPDRALQMARSLLNMAGAGSLVDATYSRLHVRNAAVADQFLREAIAAARSAYDPRMLEGISWAAFGNIGLQVDPPTESPVPEELRSAILNVIAEAMLRPAQSEEDQKNICLASLTAARLISKFPPDVGGQVRAAIESCKGKTVPAVARTVDAELSGKFSGSPDELLRAAADESSASTRATMKMQAAVKLAEKDPVRALDVLDSIPPEDRRMIGIRPHLALQAFSAAYKTHDTVAMQRILDHTPDDDRPDVLLNAATVAFRAKDNALGFAYLRDARGVMQKWNPQDDWRPFLTLLNLYAQHMPAETVHVMAEAMAGMARVKPRDTSRIEKTGPPVIRIPPMGDELRIVNIDPAVLDIDPLYVAASIKQIDDPASRTVLRLGLLQDCLRRYQVPAPKPKPAPGRAAEPPASNAPPTKSLPEGPAPESKPSSSQPN
jgi:hypothetical protein